MYSPDKFDLPLPFEAHQNPTPPMQHLTRQWQEGGEDWGELYDLQADPVETRNLWDDLAYAEARAALSLRLIAQLTAQMDESPLAEKLA